MKGQERNVSVCMMGIEAAADREGGFRSAPPVVPEGSGVPALIEVVCRNGLGIGGIEVEGLVEVVGGGTWAEESTSRSTNPRARSGARDAEAGR